MRNRRRLCCRGFTLLELLVAITVLAIVSLIAWRGLDSLVHTRERLQPRADDVRDLLVAFGQMERDLEQIVNTSFVPLPSPPVIVHASGLPGFELVRLSPAAPGATSTIQLVVYELREGRLLRRASAPMDTIGPLDAAPLATTPLLADVRALRIRVWQAGRGWVPVEAGAATDARVAPPGLEVTVERADGREYRRVLLTG